MNSEIKMPESSDSIKDLNQNDTKNQEGANTPPLKPNPRKLFMKK